MTVRIADNGRTLRAYDGETYLGGAARPGDPDPEVITALF